MSLKDVILLLNVVKSCDLASKMQENALKTPIFELFSSEKQKNLIKQRISRSFIKQ